MTHIAPRRLKRLRQIRRLHPTLLFEENSSQYQRLKKRHLLALENEVQRSFHPPRNPAGLKDRTLPQKRFNPHRISLFVAAAPLSLLLLLRYPKALALGSLGSLEKRDFSLWVCFPFQGLNSS